VFFVIGAEERTALAGRTDEAAGVLLDHRRPVRGRRSSAVHPRLGELNARQDDALLKETKALQQRKHRIMPGIPALAVVAAALLAWRITRSITGTLADTVAPARSVASGGLPVTADATGRDASNLDTSGRTENQEADQLAGVVAGFRLERRAADVAGEEAVSSVGATPHATGYPRLA
jgi:methyl-accepting chemotaxis protein